MNATRAHLSIAWWLPVFVLGSFVLYWPVLHLSAFSDDHSALWNAGVKGIPWRNGFLRPLSDLTFRVGTALLGPSPEGHRSFNVALHGFNAFLLFILCRQWSGARAAMLGAVLFLVYPFHQESIVWLVGRESALGTATILVALIIGGTRLPHGTRCLLMATIMSLGALCYESALLLGPLALFIGWSRQVPNWPRTTLLAITLCLATLAYFLLRSALFGSEPSGYLTGLLPTNWTELFLRVPKTLGRLFLPPTPDTTAQLLRGAGLCISLLLFAILIRRSPDVEHVRRRLALLTVLALLSCSVAFGAGVSTITSESDRFLHLPSAFLCAAAGLLISCMQRPLFRWISVSALVLTSILLMRENHSHWQQASLITARCVETMPPIPDNGYCWVSGLPEEELGAFIFRNGFPEALLLGGKRGDRVIVVPANVSRKEAQENGLVFRGTFHKPGPHDVWYDWADTGFRPSMP